MTDSGKHTKWYKSWWKTLIAFVGGFTFVWGILEGVYQVTEWVHEEELKEEKIELLEKTVQKIINEDKEKDKKIQSLQDYVDDKNQSFAVGFRVFIKEDPYSNDVVRKKMYRDWNGVWHEVHLDHKYTNYYGIDYYYYISKESGEKVYCW